MLYYISKCYVRRTKEESARRDPEMQSIMDWNHYKINKMYIGVHVMFIFNWLKLKKNEFLVERPLALFYLVSINSLKRFCISEDLKEPRWSDNVKKCEVSWDLDTWIMEKRWKHFLNKVFVFVNPSGEMVTCKMSMEKCWISPLRWFQLSLNEICKFWTGYSFSLWYHHPTAQWRV